jgi:hypothetical protein
MNIGPQRNRATPVRWGYWMMAVVAALTLGGRLATAVPAATLEDRLRAAGDLKTYGQRAELYAAVNRELQRRGIHAGFFGAASSVMSVYQWGDATYEKLPTVPHPAALQHLRSDLAEAWNQSPNTRRLMAELSRKLAVSNARTALELLGSRGLDTPKGVIRDPVAIDTELARREQQLAQTWLSGLSASERKSAIAALDLTMAACATYYRMARGDILKSDHGPIVTAIALVSRWHDLPGQAKLTYANATHREEISRATSLLCRPADARIVINAQTRWTPTELQVAVGDAVEVEALGRIKWGEGGSTSTPDGSAVPTTEIYVAPAVDDPKRVGALIGKLGASSTGNLLGDALVGAFDISTSPFMLGERKRISITSAGPLVLGVNDAVLVNNEGSFLVSIRVIRAKK